MTEQPFFASGAHRVEQDGKQVAILSAHDWQEFSQLLLQVSAEDNIVVSPEIITVAGYPSLEILSSKKDEIQQRIEHVKSVSFHFPKTTFVLGTPIFLNNEKPCNGVLFIQNGEEKGFTSKRAGATAEEYEHFSFTPTQAVLIPGSQIALCICADFIIAKYFVAERYSEEQKNTALSKLGHKHLIADESSPFIHPEAIGLIVIACWGIGGNPGFMEGLNQDEIDQYYFTNLRGTARLAFINNSQLQSIVVSDRTPTVDDGQQVTSYPLNVHFQRNPAMLD